MPLDTLQDGITAVGGTLHKENPLSWGSDAALSGRDASTLPDLEMASGQVCRALGPPGEWASWTTGISIADPTSATPS